MDNNNVYHIPVLVREVVHYIAPKPHGVYVDCTFGGGGHTRAILDAEPTCTVIAFDWDKNALERNGPLLQEAYKERFVAQWGNFAHIDRLLDKLSIEKVDGILADFGTSQFQITQEAGFSFKYDTPLDMRMSSGHQKITAYEIINKASEDDLATIFYTYGEERFGRKIAQAIIKARAREKISTTGQLAAVITSVIPARLGTIHPATRVFQALRIVINKELENITSFLSKTPGLLHKDGRLVCISFHSLEDRIVKDFIRNNDQEFTNLTPKIVVASEQEIRENPSSRSAKLRAAQRK